MFLPIHDENPRRITPVVTLLLIAGCVGAWFFVQGMGSGLPFAASLCDLGLIPGELLGRSVGEATPIGEGIVCVVDPHASWWTVLTSMFMHGGWMHLIGNLWFLWMFGDNVEERLGHVWFLLLYVACGIAAAAVQIAIDPASPIPMVGASGAISGVMGAYIVMFPHVAVRVLTVLIIFITVIRVPAWVMLGIWFAMQLLGGLPQLDRTEAGVAFWAHIGGFGAGVVIAFAALALGGRRGATPGRDRGEGGRASAFSR